MLAQECLTADPQEVNGKRKNKKNKFKKVKPSNYWVRTNCSNTTKPNYTQTEQLLDKTINHQRLINKRVLSMNSPIFEWLFTYMSSHRKVKDWTSPIHMISRFNSSPSAFPVSQILYSYNCIPVKLSICINNLLTTHIYSYSEQKLLPINQNSVSYSGRVRQCFQYP